VKELGLDDLKKNSFESLFSLSTKPLGVQEHSFYIFFSRSTHMQTKLLLDLHRTNLSGRIGNVRKIFKCTIWYFCQRS